MSAHRFGFWLASGVVGAVLCTLPAYAQQSGQAAAADAPEPGLDEITVTARRVAEDLQKVPVAVTALTAARIEELAINTPLDMNKISGLTNQAFATLTSVTFNIRGQGNSFGGKAGVFSYFAEVPGFETTFYDLQNIQVIKGPQGTLFGQTSTGGVVLFEPKRPDSHAFGGYLTADAGNRNYLQFEGAVNIPLIEDKLAVRVAAQRRERDGWTDGVFSSGQATTDLSNVDNTLWRVGIDWTPTDTVDVYTLYAGSNVKSHGTATPIMYFDSRFMNPAARNFPPSLIPQTAAPFEFYSGYAPPAGQTWGQLAAAALAQQNAAGDRTTYTNYDHHQQVKGTGFVNQISWDILDNLTVRNIYGVSWQKTTGPAAYDQDGTNLPLINFLPPCRFVQGTTSANGQCAETGGWDSRTWTEELQLRGTLMANRLQWQTGYFYINGGNGNNGGAGSRKFHESGNDNNIVFGSPVATSSAFCAQVGIAAPCTQFTRNTASSYAFFGQGTYEVVKDVHVTAGYRQTWDRNRADVTGGDAFFVNFHGVNVLIPYYGNSPNPNASIITTETKTPSQGSYNLSADWQATDDVLLYLAHRKGYKGGGINRQLGTDDPLATFGPEITRDVEIGAKTRWEAAGMRGTTNLSVYHQWYSDIQSGSVVPGTATTITGNIASASITGAELEATVYPREWLRLGMNLTYTDAKFDDWTELSTCGTQYFRPQCAGLPALTPVTIDHAGGSLTINGVTEFGRPDLFANTSKYQWSFQPALLLKQWTGADITISANIYHRDKYVDLVAVANYSKLIGLPPLVQDTPYDTRSNGYINPGYTIADARVDWRNVMDSRASVALGVTNLSNKSYYVNSSSAFDIIGIMEAVQAEPRMWFGSVRYEF